MCLCLDLDGVAKLFDILKPVCDAQKVERFEQAAALAARLVARRAHSFRVQPGFVYFRKMNVALARLKEVSIQREITEMRKAICVHRIQGKYYLPTPENFQYFLVCFQNYTKILIRIAICARESFQLFMELLRRAAFVDTLTVFIGALARIWTDSVEFCKTAVRFYDEFYPFFRRHFDQKNLSGLPESLTKWLGDDFTEYINVDTEVNSKFSIKDQDLFLFDDIDEIGKKSEQIESTTIPNVIPESKFQPKLILKGLPNKSIAVDMRTQNYQKKAKVRILTGKNELRRYNDFIVLLSQAEAEKLLKKEESVRSSSQLIDLGEKIERTPVQVPTVDVKSVKPVKVCFLDSVKKIRKFITKEDLLRRQGSPQNTVGISDEAWKEIKRKVDGLLILGQDKLAVKKFKALWHERVDSKQ